MTRAFVPLLARSRLGLVAVPRRPDRPRRRRPRRGHGALVAPAAALFLIPRFDVVKSARGDVEGAAGSRWPGETYGIYPRLDSTFLFYTGRFAVELDSEQKLRELRRAGPGGSGSSPSATTWRSSTRRCRSSRWPRTRTCGRDTCCSANPGHEWYHKRGLRQDASWSAEARAAEAEERARALAEELDRLRRGSQP